MSRVRVPAGMSVQQANKLLRDSRVADSFNPLSIGWHSAFWAEAPTWTNPGNGNTVSQWDDVAGSSRHATQATSGNRPTFRSSVSVLNNCPALEFDGSNDWMAQAAFTALDEPGEIWFVGALTNLNDAYGYFVDGNVDGLGPRWTVGRNNADKWELFQGTIIDNGTTDLLGHCFDAQFATGSSDALLVDGVSVISGNAGSLQCRGLTLGAAVLGGSSHLGCYIAFVGLKASPLTSQERLNLLGWSRSHYETP